MNAVQKMAVAAVLNFLLIICAAFSVWLVVDQFQIAEADRHNHQVVILDEGESDMNFDDDNLGGYDDEQR